MKLPAFLEQRPRPAHHLRQQKRRKAGSRDFCQALESRLLLSGGAPAAFAVNDTVVLLETAGTGTSLPPNDLHLQALSATQLSFASYPGGTNSTGTASFTYTRNSATGATLSAIAPDGAHTIVLTFSSASVSTGTFTEASASGTQSGVFNYTLAGTPVLAPAAASSMLFTTIAANGQYHAGYYSVAPTPAGTFSINWPASSGSNSVGTYTYTQTDNTDATFAYTDTTHGSVGIVYMTFTSATTGYFLNTDATGSNSLSDYQVGTFAVQATPTTTVVAPSANPVIHGTAVTFQATVTPTTATGTVTFMDGQTVLGTQSVDGNGNASLTTSSLTLGTHVIAASYSGDANFSGSTSTAVNQFIVYSHASNQAYVNQLYTDVLGRTADPGGLQAWTALLDAGTDTLAAVATAFTSSREYDGNIVDGFYTKYLNRHAEAGGLNDWVNLMQGGYNAEQIRAGILGSPEYFGDTGGTNTSFVTALYQSFLNRAPDPNGLNDWVNLLVAHTDTTAQVATGFLNSDENRTDIITGFYTTYLHRAPDPGGLSAWKGLLANGITQPQIITFFVTTPEYLALNNIT